MEDGHAIQGSNPATRVKNPQFVNKLYPHCLSSVVWAKCYHLVGIVARPTDSKQVVPKSLISSARDKLLTSW
jgi:hypothetical protein